MWSPDWIRPWAERRGAEAEKCCLSSSPQPRQATSSVISHFSICFLQLVAGCQCVCTRPLRMCVLGLGQTAPRHDGEICTHPPKTTAVGKPLLRSLNSEAGVHRWWTNVPALPPWPGQQCTGRRGPCPVRRGMAAMPRPEELPKSFPAAVGGLQPTAGSGSSGGAPPRAWLNVLDSPRELCFMFKSRCSVSWRRGRAVPASA